MLKHFLFSKPKIPKSQGPSSLFLPVITTSHTPISESDYNFHKSNSTYFTDADITRGHLVCCLLQPGIEKLHHNVKTKLVLDKEGKAVTGKFGMMLGSVMCSFKREIGIYESYEMWSRLLCWDRKWMYVVSHFVKKGTVRPTGYVLGDGSWFRKKGYTKVEGAGGDVELDQKAIFASAIGKYVVKLGRLTVHPEVVLQASGLLPDKPGGWATMTSSGDSTPELGESTQLVEDDEGVDAGDEWNWKRIEAENHRGLKFAEHFAALDGLNQEFSGSQSLALGKYRDFLL